MLRDKVKILQDLLNSKAKSNPVAIAKQQEEEEEEEEEEEDEEEDEEEHKEVEEDGISAQPINYIPHISSLQSNNNNFNNNTNTNFQTNINNNNNQHNNSNEHNSNNNKSNTNTNNNEMDSASHQYNKNSLHYLFLLFMMLIFVSFLNTLLSLRTPLSSLLTLFFPLSSFLYFSISPCNLLLFSLFFLHLSIPLVIFSSSFLLLPRSPLLFSASCTSPISLTPSDIQNKASESRERESESARGTHTTACRACQEHGDFHSMSPSILHLSFPLLSLFLSFSLLPELEVRFVLLSPSSSSLSLSSLYGHFGVLQDLSTRCFTMILERHVYLPASPLPFLLFLSTSPPVLPNISYFPSLPFLILFLIIH